MAKNETAELLGDDRLVQSAAREDRSSADAERINKDGTALTLAERRKQMRSEWTQDVLPTPPKVPGWHFCWLSTTNSSDPIYRRVQKGYTPVRVSELTGFTTEHASGGEFDGVISCNEMLLFKIEEELYQDIMMYLHHELPMSEEELLKANAKPAGADSDGRDLGDVEGFEALARKVKTPTFSA